MKPASVRTIGCCLLATAVGGVTGLAVLAGSPAGAPAGASTSPSDRSAAEVALATMRANEDCGLGQRQALAVGLPVAEGPIYGVFNWGDNSDGQVGDGTTNQANTPVEIPGIPQGASDIAAGSDFALAIGSDGNLYAWGDNSEGQLGLGGTTSETSPVEVTLGPGVQPDEIAAGSDFALAIGSDGNLYAWGDNSDGQLGLGDTTSVTSPTVVSLPSGAAEPEEIAAGSDFSMMVDENSNLYTWGDNSEGQLGLGDTTSETSPTAVSFQSQGDVDEIAAGGEFAMATDYSGDLWTWGDNSDGQLGLDDNLDSQIDSPDQVNIDNQTFQTDTIAAGSDFALAIGYDDNVYAWGDNSDGQLGIGTTFNQDQPVTVAMPTDDEGEQIAAGANFAMAIESDCDLYSWGDNSDGQLGNGTTTSSDLPTAVSFPQSLLADEFGPEPESDSSYVLMNPQAPVVTASSTSFTVGQAGDFQVPWIGSPPPSFTETGALPAGITLSSSGVLSGTPAAGTAGAYPITLEASNAVPPDSSTTFTITVDAAPHITSAASVSFPLGHLDSFHATATGYPQPTVIEIGSLPPGVSFSSGVISGTPKAGSAGSYLIGLVASNGQSPDAVQLVTLKVPKLDTTTKLKASANPVALGKLVTFTGAVADVAGLPPLGTVDFKVNGTTATSCAAKELKVISGGAVERRAATCTVKLAHTGSYQVEALYSGAHDFVVSHSTVLKETVRS